MQLQMELRTPVLIPIEKYYLMVALKHEEKSKAGCAGATWFVVARSGHDFRRLRETDFGGTHYDDSGTGWSSGLAAEG